MRIPDCKEQHLRLEIADANGVIQQVSYIVVAKVVGDSGIILPIDDEHGNRIFLSKATVINVAD